MCEYNSNFVEYIDGLTQYLKNPTAVMVLLKIISKYQENVFKSVSKWVPISDLELSQELFLSQNKIHNYRKILIDNAMIECKRQGLPSRLHYYINTQLLKLKEN